MFRWRTHPDEENLLRFCDGELRTRDASRVARHLDTCWECRTHVDDIRKIVGEYVHYRKDTLQASLPGPPEPWMDLNREFQRIRAEQSRRAEPGAMFRRPMAWILLSGAVLLASTTVLLNKVDRSARKQLDNGPRVVTRPHRSSPAEITEDAPAAAMSKPRDAHSTPEPPSVSADDELNVIAALHRIGADLGDPIEVVRKKDVIIVSCTDLEPARADEMRALLSGMPTVSVQLSARTTPPAQTDSRAPLVESGQTSPLEPQISRQFGDRLAFYKIVDETLQSSEAMMARAHALRGLADRFPIAVAAQMSPSSVALLTSIRQEHTSALANHVAAIDRSMNPILRSLGASFQVQQPSALASWQERTYQLFSSAARVDRLLGTLLAPTAGSLRTEATPSDLATALDKVNADVRSYQQLLADGQKRGGR